MIGGNIGYFRSKGIDLQAVNVDLRRKETGTAFN